MAANYDSLRLRNQKAIDARLTAAHRRIAEQMALEVIRAAGSDGLIPNDTRTREALRLAIWEKILKPFYVGAGADALIGPEPQSPYARLLVEGITTATRIQAERQAAIVRRVCKDDEVVAWLTGPKPSGLLVVPAANMTPLPLAGIAFNPARDTLGGLRGPDGRVDVARAKAALVRPRSQYSPFHEWVDPRGYRLSDRIWNTSVEVRARVDQLLTYHVAAGTGAVEMAKLMEPFMTPGGRVSKTKTPYGSEGSYAARRLARTEISANAHRATAAASVANPFVGGIQWRLSASHPKIDICDQYARGGPNGDGIYPPEQVPGIPHPHCLCSTLPVPIGSTADLVETLRADIQAARGNLIDAASGGNAARGQALQGLLNPDYLTKAMMSGTLEQAIQDAASQAATKIAQVVPTATPKPVATPQPVLQKAVPVGPTPLGTPVSGALQIPQSGKYNKVYQETLDAIDKVHGDGALPTLPVKTKSNMDAFGQFRYMQGSGKPVDITINGKGDHHQLTLAHETGHFLDYQAIGSSGRPASMQRGVMDKWREAVDNSEAVKRLREKRRNPSSFEVEQAFPSGRTYLAKPDSTYLIYTLDEKELWARSYAQYIATRSGNANMLAQVQKERLDPIYGERQWADDDFAPIAAAIDVLFRGLGWLR